MNKYKITFTSYPIKDGKISHQSHFSGCRATIEGETFEDAVRDFRKIQLESGVYIGFITEGDLLNIAFFDIQG